MQPGVTGDISNSVIAESSGEGMTIWTRSGRPVLFDLLYLS